MDAGDATEEPQADAVDLQPLPPGDQGMAELVDEHRTQEQHGRDDAGGGVGPVAVAGRLNGVATPRQAEREQGGHSQERPVDTHADAGDAADAEGVLHPSMVARPAG